MTVYESLQLMVAFAALIISLISIIVGLVKSDKGTKKIITPA